MEKYRFLLSGSGGQGIITMAILLAEAAAIYEGLTAVQSQVYGPEARGGATRSDVIVSDSAILFPKVTQPGVLVALNQSSFMKYGNLVRPGGLLLTDSRMVHPGGGLDARHVALPLYETVMAEFGKAQALNICTLGALIGLTGVISPSSAEKVLEQRFPRAAESNARALRLGLELAAGEGGMNIHEYQAKELFRSYGIPVPEGRVAEHASEAAAAARELGPDVVIKAQIHAGGRGRAGGVKPASTPEEAERIAASLLGRALITGQTGPEGRMVRAVLVERGQKIARELYAAVTLDRAAGRPVLMASPDGGMDIEAVAADTPERLIRVMADPLYGLTDFEARRAAAFLGFTGRDLHACARLLKNLFRLYAEKDASLAEINPLIVTEDGDILALDAKLNFEDNALFRHPELAGLADAGERDPLELEAERHGLNYIRLDGNVGVMVNGAGLAMATMDLIKQAGGDPANFLDVGGGAGAAKIAAGFRIILSDPRVRAILVNIFGGILRCDLLAEGVVAAAKEAGVSVPIIVRMQGTNAEAGRRILAASGLAFTVAETLGDAARLVAEVR